MLQILTRGLGWKQREQIIEPNQNAQLVRFFSQSPNFLDTPEDEQLFNERAEVVLGPRKVDDGKASYWEAISKQQCRNIIAQYSIRQGKLRRITALAVARSLVEEQGFHIDNAPDNNAYECVAQLHRLIDMSSPGSLTLLISTIRDELNETPEDESADTRVSCVAHETFDKDNIKQVLRSVVEDCDNIDLSGLDSWVHSVIEDVPASN